MGLKYEVFMLRGYADTLHKQLLEKFAGRIIDTTDLSRREREWYQRPAIKTDDFDTFKDWLDPKDPELEAWMKDGHERGFSIWFMDHPSENGIVVGGFTTHWFHDEIFMSSFAGILFTLGYEEFLKSSFFHTCNDGNILKIRVVEPVSVETYDHLDGENERWEKYSKRVDKICGYPICSWHHYISAPNTRLIPWKYSVQFKKEEKHE